LLVAVGFAAFGSFAGVSTRYARPDAVFVALAGGAATSVGAGRSPGAVSGAGVVGALVTGALATAVGVAGGACIDAAGPASDGEHPVASKTNESDAKASIESTLVTTNRTGDLGIRTSTGGQTRSAR
jgi:hypothetical protein